MVIYDGCWFLEQLLVIIGTWRHCSLINSQVHHLHSDVTSWHWTQLSIWTLMDLVVELKCVICQSWNIIYRLSVDCFLRGTAQRMPLWHPPVHIWTSLPTLLVLTWTLLPHAKLCFPFHSCLVAYGHLANEAFFLRFRTDYNTSLQMVLRLLCRSYTIVSFC